MMTADPDCPNCGHPWAEHSKLNGCEHKPFCWCHLLDPAAAKADLDEFTDADREEGSDRER